MHYIGISLCGLFLVYISMVAVANGIKRMFSNEEERQRDTLSVYAREFADLFRITALPSAILHDSFTNSFI